MGRWRVDTLPCRNLPDPHGLSHRRYSGSLPPHLSPHGRSTATCPGHSGPLEESSGCPDQGELSEARPLLRVCTGRGCAAHAPCHHLPWAGWVTGGMVEEAHQPGTKGQQQPSEELLRGREGAPTCSRVRNPQAKCFLGVPELPPSAGQVSLQKRPNPSFPTWQVRPWTRRPWGTGASGGDRGLLTSRTQGQPSWQQNIADDGIRTCFRYPPESMRIHLRT